MKLSSVIASMALVFLASFNALAYTVSFGSKFPSRYESKSFEIANKAAYERVLVLRDLIIQNLKDQDAVVRYSKDADKGYSAFLRLREQNVVYFNELDSILGVRR